MLTTIERRARVFDSAGKPVQRIRAVFDSAQSDATNRKHWAGADGLSANAAANPSTRETLRRRARYEYQNNSDCFGIVSTLADFVNGTGPRLNVTLENASVARRIERSFNEWARVVGLGGILRLARISQATDGAMLLVFQDNPRVSHSVPLDLVTVDLDRLRTPNWTASEQQPVDGIRFDQWGNPAAYDILDQHPGDLFSAGWAKATSYPAEFVIHYFRRNRPEQSHGIPELTPALPLFALLRRYTLASIVAAETAANLGMVAKSDYGADTSAALPPLTEIEITPNMLTVLPDGLELQQIETKHPSSSHAEIRRALLSEIARCLLQMPVHIASGDSSKHNYSSAQLDGQVFKRAVEVDRAGLETSVLRRIFEMWMKYAVVHDGVIRDSGLSGSSLPPHRWYWDSLPHADPTKEAEAAKTRLEAGLSSFSEELSGLGSDSETVIAQQVIEKRVRAGGGILGRADRLDGGQLAGAVKVVEAVKAGAIGREAAARLLAAVGVMPESAMAIAHDTSDSVQEDADAEQEASE